MAITEQLENYKELRLAGIPCKGLNGMSGKVGIAVPKIMKIAQQLKSWNGKHWIGVFQPCPTELEAEELVYYVSIEISNEEPIPEGAEYISIPAQRYMVIHKEKEDSIKTVYAKISHFLNDYGVVQNDDKYSYIMEIPCDELWESVQVYVPIK